MFRDCIEFRIFYRTKLRRSRVKLSETLWNCGKLCVTLFETFNENSQRFQLPKFSLPQGSVFFSCVKTKSVRETFFRPFFEFFHGQKIAFTHTFLQVFTYSQNFSRALLMIFSRMDFVFSREGYRYFLKFSYYFHACDLREIFTHSIVSFTGSFFTNFHAWVGIFTHRFANIYENFHGRDFFFSRRKKKTLEQTPPRKSCILHRFLTSEI